MKKNVNVAICTPSVILFDGIAQLLENIDDIEVSIRDLSDRETDPAERIKSERIEVVVADPLCMDPSTIERIKAAAGLKTQFIGVCSSALPQTMTRGFDHLISIYETEESIYNKLKRTCSLFVDQSSETELTSREKEIVSYIAKGLANKEIAWQMNISVNTVMTHRRNIAAKLQIHSPAGLTIYALASKLVSLEEIRVPKS